MTAAFNRPLGGHEKNVFIQVWRGIAAFLVVYFHLSNRVPPAYLGQEKGPSLVFYSGKIGLLIFFVISGYLIVQSLLHSRTLASFYAKRVSRLWPLFILATITIYLWLQYVPPPVVLDGPKQFYTQQMSIADVAGTLFFLQDLGFDWVDGAFWSILVELKFYFWIGIVAAIGRKDFVRSFAIASIILSGLELILELSGVPALRPARYVLNGIFVAQYLPFFAIGGLLVTGKHAALLVILILIAAVQSLMVVSGSPEFDIWHTAEFGLILAGVVTVDALFLQNRIFLTIGDYSYSWYLFHQMIGLSLMKAINPWVGYDDALIFALVATFGIAVAASNAVEWRFREYFYRPIHAVLARLGLQRIKFSRQQVPAKGGGCLPVTFGSGGATADLDGIDLQPRGRRIGQLSAKLTTRWLNVASGDAPLKGWKWR